MLFLRFLDAGRFLDAVPGYLQARFEEDQLARRPFYVSTLVPLFRYLGSPAAPPLRARFGRVPRLGADLFLAREVEATSPGAAVGDAALRDLLDLFDRYEWRLRDDGPPGALTPHVLGFVLERQINRKAAGAYYTPDDVTAYISRSAIVPCTLEKLAARLPETFAAEGPVWRLLKDQPERYLFPANLRGLKGAGTFPPLPAQIEAGLADPTRRAGWEDPADPELALPGESWRDYLARRQHTLALIAELRAGRVSSVQGLVTANLDLERFLKDAIATSGDPAVVRSIWTILAGGDAAGDDAPLAVLDPTCGAGAFLIAAIRVLQPLYAACLARMDLWMKRPAELPSDTAACFAAATERAGGSATREREGAIIGAILRQNLYGVDLMPEAAEICKLRLLLHLLAAAPPAAASAPWGAAAPAAAGLNIRTGNALAGSVHLPAGGGGGPEQGELPLPGAGTAQPAAGALSGRGDDATRTPFNWREQFPGVMARGGFDVIIGNPPYVEYSRVKQDYTVRNYQTESCGNLYAFVTERCYALLHRRGWLGFIVPLSIVATARMSPLQKLLRESWRPQWLSSYDVYPSKLFQGAKQRLTILVAGSRGPESRFFTTRYNRWKPEERTALFETLRYGEAAWDQSLSVLPRAPDPLSVSILGKLGRFRPAPLSAGGGAPVYVHRIPYNYVKALDFVPFFQNETDGRKRSEDYKSYYLTDDDFRLPFLAMLNSSLFFWWWYTLFEGYHCGRHEIEAFPCGFGQMTRSTSDRLSGLADELMIDYRANAKRRVAYYRATGRVEYDEFRPRASKPLLDRIDAVLAGHFGLSAEELDFITSYDLKLRAGFPAASKPGPADG